MLTVITGRDRVVIADLDLDTALGGELGNAHRVEHALEHGGVALALETVVESVQVGSSNHVVEIGRLHTSVFSESDQPLSRTLL